MILIFWRYLQEDVLDPNQPDVLIPSFFDPTKKASDREAIGLVVTTAVVSEVNNNNKRQQQQQLIFITNHNTF